MKQVWVLCLALLSVAAATKLKWHELSPDYTFETYVKTYGKSYPDAREYAMRKAIFEGHLANILAHNKDETKTWKLEINHLADWTEEEFSTLRGYNKAMINHKAKAKESRQTALPLKPLPTLPGVVDWRTAGVVTPVKDQGQCGSCWSFSAAESIESHWALSKGQLWELSEQQILDCTSNPKHCGGTGGCGGGTYEIAFDSIIAVGGLSSEWTYAYQSGFGQDNPKCLLKPNTTFPVKISDYVVLPSNQYTPLLNAVATVGPISISVDAGAWRFYSTGVFNGCNQTNPDIDHAVQLVGYGTENGQDYWLVRNSWSPAWGDNGYIKLLRTSNVQCGTDLTPGDGSGCDGGPPTVTVCGTCGILYDTAYPVI